MSFPRSKLARREAFEGYVFLLPWIIGFLAFHFGPLLASLYLGFTNYRGSGPPQWIGVENFQRMFTADPLFWQSLKVTVLYALGYLPLGLVIGFGIALLMNQKVRGISVFRTVYYLPSVMTGVAVAILWQFVFHREYGVLNSILRIFGAEPVAWLNNSQWVLRRRGDDHLPGRSPVDPDRIV
jgi:multiple sugar transport system permease protein